MSCAEDTAVEDPYANWQVRNEHYIDSIADVARANVEGNWEIYRNYKVQNANFFPDWEEVLLLITRMRNLLLLPIRSI